MAASAANTHPAKPNANTPQSNTAAQKGPEEESLAKRVREYTMGEEIFSAIAHGVGALLGVVGLVFLIIFSVREHDAFKLAASLVYGISIILEFTASTFYHALTNAKAKYVFKILDHSSIYLLIAGTYTPFCLVTLRDSGGILLAAIIWTLAIAGIATEAAWVFRPRWLSVVIYVAMGWLIVFKVNAFAGLIEPAGLWLLIGGGVAYTLGTIFYVLKKVKYMHSVWHLWVLAGAILHYFAVLLYVII